MPLQLPPLAKSRCVLLTACGELTSASADLRKWMAGQPPIVASFKQRNEKRYLRAYFGGDSGRHLHIDLLTASMFVSTPKKTVSINDALNKLERLAGLEIVSTFQGKFEVRIADLPAGGIIQSLFLKSKNANVEITVSGANFEITGAPISEIRWVQLSDNKIGVSIEAEFVKTTVSEDYLTSAFDTLETGLDVFVLKSAK